MFLHPILQISDNYKKTNSIHVEEYMEDLNNIFRLAQQVDELDINLDVGYDLQAAVADFKAGIEFFK